MVEMKWVEDDDKIALFYRVIKPGSLIPAGLIEWTDWKKVEVEPKSKILDA